MCQVEESHRDHQPVWGRTSLAVCLCSVMASRWLVVSTYLSIYWSSICVCMLLYLLISVIYPSIYIIYLSIIYYSAIYLSIYCVSIFVQPLFCPALCDPHVLQHTRLPCPSLSPGVSSNSCLSPLSPPALILSQHQGLFQ